MGTSTESKSRRSLKPVVVKLEGLGGWGNSPPLTALAFVDLEKKTFHFQ